MSDSILSKVQEMIKEETWTRATISNYTVNQFESLKNILDELEPCKNEAKQICDDHLANTKNSIVALYFSSMLGLKGGDKIDNSNLATLINIFVDNHKLQVVVYLCNEVLKIDKDNTFAWKTLASCYDEDKSLLSGETDIWEIYENIVRLDADEADIAKTLADHYAESGDTEMAKDYYKKSLLRYVANKNLSKVKEIWKLLIDSGTDEIEFFYLVQRKIAKTIDEKQSALLMLDLYAYYKPLDIDIAIDILKLVLSIDESDERSRKELVECYREKYSDDPEIDDYIRSSNLGSRTRNVFEAISDFEKHIAFRKGNYVFHRSWGVGKIKAAGKNELIIRFSKRFGPEPKKLSLNMAVSALQPLSNNHIWVKKATMTKDALIEWASIKGKNKEDANKAVEDVLKTIIQSFGNSCDLKKIKAELVPGILSTSEWTSWNNKAKDILASNANFGINPDDITQYTYKKKDISKCQKYANEFKAQKNFFNRADIIMKFSRDSEAKADNAYTEFFKEIKDYFDSYLKPFTDESKEDNVIDLPVTEETIAAFLVDRRLDAKDADLNTDLSASDTKSTKDLFAKLFKKVDNPAKMWDDLKDTKNTALKKDYLSAIKGLKNWAEVYIKLFPTVLDAKLLADLIENGESAKVEALVNTSFENFRDYREAAIFFFKQNQIALTASDTAKKSEEKILQDFLKTLNLSFEKMAITLIHIEDLNFREIDSHKNTTDNKKINKNIEDLLFKDDTLLNYMLQNDVETITRLYTLVDDIKALDPTIKMRMRNKIVETHKDFKFHGTEEKVSTPKGLIVTAKMKAIKEQLLDEIQKVTLPALALEISDAIAKGDLKENAEYKAAKEKQAQLNNQVSHLQDDLNRAVVFDPTTITTSRVSFGTTVTLKNLESGETEKYTILGPWESDPENGIISYMSPFGIAVLNAKEGETLNPTINDTKYSYEVVSIEVADF